MQYSAQHRASTTNHNYIPPARALLMKTLSFILMALCAIFLPSCEVYSTDCGYGQPGYMPPPGQVMGYAPPQYRQAPSPQYHRAQQPQNRSAPQPDVQADPGPTEQFTRIHAGDDNFHADFKGATGVATWFKNGVPVPESQVPPAAKAGLEKRLRGNGYGGSIIHNKVSVTGSQVQPTQTVAVTTTSTSAETLSGIPAGYTPPAAPRLLDSSAPPVVIRSSVPAPGQ